MLDDVVAIDSSAGLALAFLSCRGPDGATTQTTASVVRADPASSKHWPNASWAQQPSWSPSTHSADHGRVARRRSPARCLLRRGDQPPDADGLAEGDHRRHRRAGRRLRADCQRRHPAVGDDAELVRRSVTPAALCYRWDNVWLSAAEPADPAALTEPSAELQTIRLALIHVTGRWIDPTDRMNAEMAAVVSAYQEARGLAVDGSIGSQTTTALAADLGCPEAGEFTMVPPSSPGHATSAPSPSWSPPTGRFASSGHSGFPSIDQLLTDARWDGRNAMFLGCYRWRRRRRTVVQLERTDATATRRARGRSGRPGLGSFSILYARSTAPDSATLAPAAGVAQR